MYSFSYLEPVCCSMSSSNCCFLSCIQIFQEAGQVAWYFHLLKNFPQFIVIHTVKGFGIANKAEVDGFLELSCFFYAQQMLAIWSLVSLPFLKPAWTSGSSWFTYCWSLAWRILSITLLVCEMNAIAQLILAVLSCWPKREKGHEEDVAIWTLSSKYILRGAELLTYALVYDDQSWCGEEN